MSVGTIITRSALCLTLLAGVPVAAQAQDNGHYRGFYGALGLGLNSVDDGDWAGGGSSGAVEYDNGTTMLGAVGYALGNGFRFEGELARRKNDVDSFTTSGVSTATAGDARVLSLMANALYDFKTGTPLTPYVGLGVGLASLKMEDATPPGATTGRETDFAWQGIVGAAIRLTDALDLTADYRYFDMGEVEITPGVDVDYTAHTFLVGLRWRFGAPPPAPMPAAEPAPQPAPAPETRPAPAPEPAPAPVQRSFLIFFDWDKADIRADTRKILEAAAAAAKKGNYVKIQLTGHADRSGAARYNQGLSERRAAAAKAILIGLGLSGDTIATVGRGETQPLVSTADGVREPRNRRVEIMF
ncbi:MAG: outer membrane beta-barrel protein [Alphaproteobacteria bacterium]|nr:outer membrane beta-barrel protein [Alphaproteobacteria bacterium]